MVMVMYMIVAYMDYIFLLEGDGNLFDSTWDYRWDHLIITDYQEVDVDITVKAT